MNHQLQVTLVIVILLGLTAITGLLVAQAIGLRFSTILTPTITGAAVATCAGADCPAAATVCAEKSGTACRVACYDDSDCDDRISATADVCKNPGTEFSICVNR